MTEMSIEEALQVLDRLERDPQWTTLVDVLLLPSGIIARCYIENLVESSMIETTEATAMRSLWNRTTLLTSKGKARLRAWRTCRDCGQECTETVHECSGRQSSSPYR